MTPTGAIEVIQGCVERDAYYVRQHVLDRLQDRSLSEIEVFGIIDEPDEVRLDGVDRHGRDRCFVNGTLFDGTRAEVLVLIDSRPYATFFTIYWIS